MFPCEKTVFVGVLTELFEHSSDFLHIELCFYSRLTAQFILYLIIFINGVHFGVDIVRLGNYRVDRMVLALLLNY